MAGNYRKNVAAIIINKDKKVLMCEHIWIDDAWQFPQGGVEEGESDEQALLREMNEEIGTKKLKVLGQMEDTVVYQFPYFLKQKYKFDGQEQTYFLLYFYGEDSEIRFDNQEKPEFKSFRWVEYTEPPLKVIYFKKLAYLKAIEYFKKTVDSFDPAKVEL